MAHYVVLGKWTEQGMKTVKDSPKRVEAVQKAIEAAGGKVNQFVFTMGPYDFVMIGEMPGDEVANELILRTVSQGNAHTLTLKGWTVAEFSKLVQKL